MKRIEKGLWWDRNWELLNGCSKVSAACENCFAENYIHRFKSRQERWQGLTDKAGHWNGTVKLCPGNLDLPLRITKLTVWFVTERGDLFHEKVDYLFIKKAFLEMLCSYQHTYLVLTKRPKRIIEFFESPSVKGKQLPEMIRRADNIYIGTTVENQEQAAKRIPHLLQIPGKKFLSIEPMLSNINIANYLTRVKGQTFKEDVIYNPIDWVIVGGESGHNARPIHPAWVRSIRDQCQAAGVPFFFKQWGNYKGPNDWTIPAGRLLDGREWNERPF